MGSKSPPVMTAGLQFHAVVWALDRGHLPAMKDETAVAGYAGEFYTSRHLITAMIQGVKPRLGRRAVPRTGPAITDNANTNRCFSFASMA
jgi:hypothetical protein